MKETVNVNIGSQAFTLDEDAYRVLRNYLEDIRSRLPEYDTETMGDIEARIAEIFREIVSSPMRVITLDTVRQTMNRMGSPADFGELAEFFGLDVSLIRIATLILILFGGLSIWVYIILWLIVPKAPKRLTE